MKRAAKRGPRTKKSYSVKCDCLRSTRALLRSKFPSSSSGTNRKSSASRGP